MLTFNPFNLIGDLWNQCKIQAWELFHLNRQVGLEYLCIPLLGLWLGVDAKPLLLPSYCAGNQAGSRGQIRHSGKEIQVLGVGSPSVCIEVISTRWYHRALITSWNCIYLLVCRLWDAYERHHAEKVYNSMPTQTAWVWVLALLFISCVNLRKLRTISMMQFLHLKMEITTL